jgi:spore germination protein
MKTANKLPIIGLAIGLFLFLGSLSLFLIFKTEEPATSTDAVITYEQYEPANVNTLEEVEIQEEDNEEKGEKKEVIQETTLKESGWIPNWAFDLGSESLVNNKGIIDTVLPVLYTVNSSGDVESRGVSTSKINDLMTYCTENNIRVLPTIGSYDFDSVSASLASEDSYKRQIDTIVSEIEKYNFDGIDLDYEMVRTSDKENFLKFLQELGQELEERDKILSVTVFAQWEGATYEDHEETRAVQDYAEVGKYAHEVRIMAYDYTLQSSKTPGPVGPLNWIEDVLDYATNRIPKEKIWLGVHLYGYQWSKDRTVAFTYTTTESAIINSSGINNIFKEDIGEGYAEFNCDGDFVCKTYFQTPRGVEMRRDIAKEYGIAGTAYWRLGGELDILK